MTRTALVTGAASGLGAAIATALGAAGFHVVLADRDAEGAERIAAGLRDASVMPIDLSDMAAAADLVVATTAARGLDVLVNNAGIDRTVDVETLTQDEFDAVLAVNLRAPFALSRAAFAAMRARGGGHIVNIVSTAARRAWANASAYHASKWGMLGLSHALHVEGRPLDIKVTAVIAGGMRTPFILDRFPDTPPENLQDPAEVADAVRWLVTRPGDSVVPELTMIPMRETSWP